MLFISQKLIKNGTIDIEYSYRWLYSLKDFDDVRDVFTDMEDIIKMLNSQHHIEHLMYDKFLKLKIKYFPYVDIVKSVLNLQTTTVNFSNVREQLEIFYNYLPLLGLLKIGVVNNLRG